MIAFREGSLCLQSHFPYFVCSEQLPLLPAPTPKLSLSPFHSRCLSNATLIFFTFSCSEFTWEMFSWLRAARRKYFWGTWGCPVHRPALPLLFPLLIWVICSFSPFQRSLPHTMVFCHLPYKTITMNSHIFPDITGPGEISSSVRSLPEQLTLGKSVWEQNNLSSRKILHWTGEALSQVPTLLAWEYDPFPSWSKTRYLNCSGRDLDLVESPHGAITVYEVGGSKLVQGFNALGGVSWLPVEAAFVHVHGQGLLSCGGKKRSCQWGPGGCRVGSPQWECMIFCFALKERKIRHPNESTLPHQH